MELASSQRAPARLGARACRFATLADSAADIGGNIVRIKAVTPLAGFTVHLTFTDGTERDIDLDPYLRGPIFEPLRSNRLLFEAVRVDAQLGTIVWPNGADIDPDVLFSGGPPEWAHDAGTRA